MNPDEAEIRDLVAKWMAATQAGDSDTLMTLMTDDVVFLRAGHSPMRKPEFAAGAKAQAAGMAPKFSGSSEIQEVVVSGEWAFLWSKLKVVAQPPDGSASTERQGYTLTVLRKDQGKWRLARDANLLA